MRKNSLIILGAGNAIPAPGNLYSQMAVLYLGKCALVDCGNNPINTLLELGVQFEDIEHLILTHFHPDHAAALPNFLAELKIRGRTEPLMIHGNPYTLDRVRQLMALFGMDDIPGNYELLYHSVEETANAVVLVNDAISIFATPMRHFIPTLGLSFTSRNCEGGIAYTSDTEPCPGVSVISTGKDILIHEANGHRQGHSSAGDAATAALESGVKELILIHYPTVDRDPQLWIQESNQIFPGTITLAYPSLRRDF